MWGMEVCEYGPGALGSEPGVRSCRGVVGRAPELSSTEPLRKLVAGRLVPVLAAGSLELAESLA